MTSSSSRSAPRTGAISGISTTARSSTTNRNDPEEWTNLADDPDYAEIKERLAGYIPENPAPLVETSYQVMPHHVRPFRSKEDYVASRQD